MGSADDGPGDSERRGDSKPLSGPSMPAMTVAKDTSVKEYMARLSTHQTAPALSGRSCHPILYKRINERIQSIKARNYLPKACVR